MRIASQLKVSATATLVTVLILLPLAVTTWQAFDRAQSNRILAEKIRLKSAMAENSFRKLRLVFTSLTAKATNELPNEPLLRITLPDHPDSCPLSISVNANVEPAPT